MKESESQRLRDAINALQNDDRGLARRLILEEVKEDPSHLQGLVVGPGSCCQRSGKTIDIKQDPAARP